MVPDNDLFDAQMKTLETIEHAQIEVLILIIGVPHVSSCELSKLIIYMNIIVHIKSYFI